MRPRRCVATARISSSPSLTPAVSRIARSSPPARSISSSAATITISSSNSTAATPWWNPATMPTTSRPSTLVIDVRQEGGRRIVARWPQFRIIDTATVVPDPEVAALVAKYKGELSKEHESPIATTAVALDSRTATVRTREAAIGDLVADAMRTSTHAEAAVTNGGGIRRGKLYRPRSAVIAGDIILELLFENRIVTIAITRAELARALENGLSQLPNANGRFPQISDLTLSARSGGELAAAWARGVQAGAPGKSGQLSESLRSASAARDANRTLGRRQGADHRPD